jgi:hypothetical protein
MDQSNHLLAAPKFSLTVEEALMEHFGWALDVPAKYSSFFTLLVLSKHLLGHLLPASCITLHH